MDVNFTLRTYLVGFFTAVVLTAIPFWIVMTGAIPNVAVGGAVIVAFAVAQILVHTVAFLHVNARTQQGWMLVAYVFTAILLMIMVAGSVWIMSHLNSNMMPGMSSDPQSTSLSP